MPRNRRKVLYPIELPVEYKLREKDSVAGHGRTRAISSDVIQFEADRGLPENRKIRLALAWPAALPDGTALNLWIIGTVTRSALCEIEVRIGSYEFRTRPAARSLHLPVYATPKPVRVRPDVWVSAAAMFFRHP